MNKLKVVDVTLRDGGCVNSFKFGNRNIFEILKAQENAGVDVIELGYIDQYKGSSEGRTQYINEKVIENNILKNKKDNIKYVAMIDYGKYDVDNLSGRRKDGIDGIRLAFHKENADDIWVMGKKIIQLGYELYLQPMLTLRYSEIELSRLICKVNQELPDASAFYIVDSFGEMQKEDISHLVNYINERLSADISLGFHSHNNLQLSYSNTIEFLKSNCNRELMIDSSILGMGKGAGNLNTELILNYLNVNYRKDYKLPPILNVIDKIMNILYEEYKWGYAVEYYLSAINHCSPSYASHFFNKHLLTIGQINELLSLLPEKKRISFDKEYAEELYRKYRIGTGTELEDDIDELKKIFENRKVVLVAPGKGAQKFFAGCFREKYGEDAIKIGLNLYREDDFDYSVITRSEYFEKAMEKGRKIIVTCQMSKTKNENVKNIDYQKWISTFCGQTYDSSTTFILNVLKACNVKKIFLFGFDGYSVNVNENYYDESMRFPLSIEQANQRNIYYQQFFSKLKSEGVDFEFLTESKYEL